MTEEITLRPATLADAKVLAQLWVATFPDKFGPVLGKKAEPVLCDWLRLSERHLQTTTIAEIEGDVIGFIVLETPAAPRADDGRWLWHALQLNNGIFGALRGMLLMLLIDTNYQLNEDEGYIEMLGVDPAWRGQGVARHLITQAEAIACQQDLSQLTLVVVSDNTPAIHLYEKMGFAINSERRSRLLKWITGHPGYYEMVKYLEK
jgi:ribosomal protein S18 acetylase RimI-like enzyme